MRHNYKKALVESIKEHQEIIQALVHSIKSGLYAMNPSPQYLNEWKDKMKEALKQAEE